MKANGVKILPVIKSRFPLDTDLILDDDFDGLEDILAEDLITELGGKGRRGMRPNFYYLSFGSALPRSVARPLLPPSNIYITVARILSFSGLPLLKIPLYYQWLCIGAGVQK